MYNNRNVAGEVRKEIKDKYVKRLYNEEKDLNTLMFENEAGGRTMYLFKKPVKYKDENGNVVDKDISFKKLDESSQGELRDRYVCHNGDNDVKIYMPMLDGIKEEIILQEYTGQTEFSFEVRLDGYKLVTLDDNGVTDFNNHYTYVEKKEGVYEITAHVNEEFLKDEDTQYPVVIDPTIEIVKANRPIGIYDATLNSTSTTEGNASWNALSMNYNPFTSSGAKMQTVSYSEGKKQKEQHRYVFDITEIVKGWRQGRSGISEDRGIAFVSSNENALIHKTFGSYNRASYNPVFEMSYVPHYGGFTLSEYSALVSQNENNGTKPNCLGLAFHSGNSIGPLNIGYANVAVGSIGIYKS